MVCDNIPTDHNDATDDHGLTPGMIAGLHHVQRHTLIKERELQELVATTGIPAALVTELTQRLTVIKVVAGGLLSDGGPGR